MASARLDSLCHLVNRERDVEQKKRIYKGAYFEDI